MELQDWLLNCGFTNRHEFSEILSKQLKGSIKGIWDKGGFLTYPDAFNTAYNLIQKHPFGDVLAGSDVAATVYERAGVKNLDELVAKWQRWHVDHLEPIAHYSTVSRFGKNLYEHVEEKKLAARFITRTHIRNAPLVNRGDTVIIPEGSSAFFVGLAVAAFRENVTIATSNAALIREHLDNPAVAKSLNDFHVIGGLVDRHPDERRCDHGGVFGTDAEIGYEFAIRESPKATVAIMPVSGLLAQEGPYATEDHIRTLKYAIIDNCLIGSPTKNRGFAKIRKRVRNRKFVKIREFVFVADYSKHDSRNADDYGAPVLDREHWARLLMENKGRISLVTVPPPATREALALNPFSHPASRSLKTLEGPSPFTEHDEAYSRTIKNLAPMFTAEGARLTLHEVYETENGVTSPSLQGLVAHM